MAARFTRAGQPGGFEGLIMTVEPGEPDDLAVAKRPEVEPRLLHPTADIGSFGSEDDRDEDLLPRVANVADLVGERASSRGPPGGPPQPPRSSPTR